VGFTSHFLAHWSLNRHFFTVQILTALFSLTVLKFLCFFRLLDRKFNEESKNVLKNVIRSLQVGFRSHFLADCSLNRHFLQFKFWQRFSPWLYRSFCVFLGYRKGNLMRIPKMYFKMWSGNYKCVLRAIFSHTDP